MNHMTDRVARLREESLEAAPSISAERALLVTDFYRNPCARELPAPLLRAKVFRHLLKNRALYIGEDELIVGEKGNCPKTVPTYPELCCHSLSDLEILDSRKKIPYSVSRETEEVFRERIIPFWEGRSMRDMIFHSMEDRWLDCFEAGVFTEFMEQRSPGHTVLGGSIYSMGMEDFRRRIAVSMKKQGGDMRKRIQLMAMDICAQSLVLFAERYSSKALGLARTERSPARKRELLEIASVCSRVPREAPSTFREAVQYYWFVHLGVTTELNPWDSFSPGKLDRHLLPFYLRDLDKGLLTPEEARELLGCLWIKFNNQPAPPKVGVTAKESSTYTDFAQINTGGLAPDGSSGVNELSYMIIDVAQEMRLLQPSLSVQIGAVTEPEFLERALEMVREGFGQPSIFNADMIVKELANQGKSVEDALLGGSSGCVEVGVFGKENYNLSGYFNLAKILEITLNSGIDPSTGKTPGPDTGDPSGFASTEDLLKAFRVQVSHFADIKIKGNAVIEKLYADRMPAPFLSLFIDDCIGTGLDYHQGGARYNTTYIQCVGLGTMVDSLSAVDHHVFREGTLGMGTLLDCLSSDFDEDEILRMRLENHTPRFGNDDERADRFACAVQDICTEAIDGRPNGRGGEYHINFLPTTVHVYFGSVTGATPDGRKAGMPLSEGISPVQGMDRQGPTAVIRSASRLDHSRTGGTLLNQKFTPALLKTGKSRKKLASLIRTYFRLGGHHIQMNVVDMETLMSAREDPDAYRGLIVRVAGYSDYFCDLSEDLQDEIIRRTAQGS
ncbi:MAG: glycyl radical protein [Candidatus Fermentibacteraceae bacterium]|nr:glycyl radical protein [Candidatus Fermentibacteraceae bacterium]